MQLEQISYVLNLYPGQSAVSWCAGVVSLVVAMIWQRYLAKKRTDNKHIVFGVMGAY